MSDEETFSFVNELKEFVEGKAILKKQLSEVKEGVSAKLTIVTLEEYTLLIDWSVANGLELKKMIVEGQDVLQNQGDGCCGGSGEEEERI